VATLPAGEDPDTLIETRGAQALAAVLGDAVDVLERKIQILERRGLFSSLPGRRRALDRLLPTLRAAADPITRELYLTRVAEVAGIRRDVLEREMGEGRGEGSVRRGGTLRAASPLSPLASPSLPAGAEKALLLLMLAGDPWPARVKDAVDPEEFEFPPYRSIYEALVDDALDRLDETAARALERLAAEGLGERDPDETFALAVHWVEARRLEREVDRLEREIPLATEDEKLRLLREKQRLASEMNAKYPRYKMLRRSSASGS
jgi:DNA primase